MTTAQKAVAYIQEHPGCYPFQIADAVAPRNRGWRPQTAAMWIGKLVRDALVDGTIYRSIVNGVNNTYWPTPR